MRYREAMSGIATTGIVAASLWAVSSEASSANNDHAGDIPVNVNVLPARLPAAVAEIASRAISVSVAYEDQANNEEILDGSGLLLSPSTAITAGHVLSIDRPKASSCWIGYAEVSTNVNSSGTTAARSADTSIIQARASYKSDDLAVPDIAWLRLANYGFIKPFKPIIFQASVPHASEELFFINFQPTNDGQARAPGGYNNKDQAPKLFFPAIYGGVYSGRQNGGLYDVITGLKNYGEISDKSARRGASGGMVVNKLGQLVGILVRSSDGQETTQSISDNLSVNLNNIQPGQKINETFVQPVTPKILQGLQNEPVLNHCSGNVPAWSPQQ